MPNYRRPKITGASIFFIVALARRGGTVLVDEIDALRDAVRVTKAEKPFHIDAWGWWRSANGGNRSGGPIETPTGGAQSVLPDHLHCVWTLPAGDRDYSTRWGAIKARFTRSIRDNGRVGFQPTHAKRLGHAVGWNPTLQRSASKIAKGDAGVWQRRFWEHHIRDEADYRAHVRYCWLNPVKHGFVERPEDWAYSSVHWDADFEFGMVLQGPYWAAG